MTTLSSIVAALIGGVVIGLAAAGLAGVVFVVGLAGYCPGPAIASLGSTNVEAPWFLPALVAGTLAHRISAGRAMPTDDEA
jgi:uncharacterized membrane protein YedE/YeeE